MLRNINDLFCAAHDGRLDEVVDCLDKGVNPSDDFISSYNPERVSCLIAAVRHRHFEIAKKLIEAKADLEKKDIDGRTALCYAAINLGRNNGRNNEKLVMQLIYARASLSTVPPSVRPLVENLISKNRIRALLAGFMPQAGANSLLRVSRSSRLFDKNVMRIVFALDGASPNPKRDAAPVKRTPY
jgi:hypothetical protein